MKRFDEFIQISMNLNNMEKDINKCLENIQYLREYNKIINKNLLENSKVIMIKKKKSINIQKTLHLVRKY